MNESINSTGYYTEREFLAIESLRISLKLNIFAGGGPGTFKAV